MRHVAISGNMGVGKSTLADALAQHIGAIALLEGVAENPYLDRFYLDMPRWSFHSQFTFLSQAFRQHCDIINSPDPSQVFVQDRTIYEHFGVFATSHLEQGLMSPEEYRTLNDHYSALIQVVPGPDLMIYLKASVPTLMSRINGRNRNCETGISEEYLVGLQERYERWIAKYNASDLIIIETDNLDIHDPSSRKQLLDFLAEKITPKQQVLPIELNADAAVDVTQAMV